MSKAKPRIKKRGLSWEIDFGRVRRPDGAGRDIYRPGWTMRASRQSEATSE